MIKINLATKKQPVAVVSETTKTGTATGTLGTLEAFTRDARLDGLDPKAFAKIGALILATVVAWYLLESRKASELERLDGEIATLNAEKARIEAQILKTKESEKIKTALEADELMIRTKIDTVQKLIQDRQTPPRVLLVLSSAIPQNVWLTEFTIKQGEVTFKGNSLGFGVISDFMKAIGESAMFMDVQLKGTERTNTGAQNQALASTDEDVASFEISAKRRATF